ncbi:helix-turn-helix domain-containing protein [Myceligenerans pegani]|uniref:Helix-turn-helix domain-containing protein n=1 Tax=Myceligenerans pegani TaxID=2776917 RepID=A0ABR9N6M0_9MICO|nr:helix-turn-helix transcriptional regulator [Myceligenerans sp. TRM 65318]MBE1878856.1 helix-turn-helix domain-containing protein [Myceligenerans sp. TRM 65318]MBE3021127.1 helix-turn-helix domain-containing protein [Myceligenerans sp. TRM 65318]
MPGDQQLGAMLRQLRTSRGLTLAAVTRQVGCAESLLSYVEKGRRQLQPWLAEALDAVYGTGGAIATLASGADTVSHTRLPNANALDDVVVLRPPEGGVTMPISRRELLAGLTIGALGGTLASRIDDLLDRLELAADGDSLAAFERAFVGFATAARSVPPAQLIGDMTGKVALLDRLGQRASTAQRTAFAVMQARYVESLSWLCEEAGDLSGALYWVDRAAQWAATARWEPMIGYTFVRRSMLVVNFTGDGLRAVDAVAPVLSMTDLAWVRGLAYKQTAMGLALAGQADASERALDETMRLLARASRDDEAHLGQRSVVGDNLRAVYQTTCDIYLGRGDSVIDALQPRLDGLAHSSLRTATISRAKLARAYANAGQPDDSLRLAWDALDACDQVGSHSALSEVRRTLPVLRRWEHRADVRSEIADLTHRLSL